MTAPVFAAAQCSVRAGDITENVRRHLLYMRLAHKHGVQLLVFPELSLTGYEPTLASVLAQGLDTSLMTPLRKYAREAKMTTVVGLPLRSKIHEKPLIAAFILHADGTLTVHTKQHLHTGEELYFSPGDGGNLLQINDVPLALSIYADFSQPAHAAAAAQAGARLYVASVLIGDGGYPADSAMLKGYAETHRMAVMMANHGGPTGGWSAAGRSAFWDEDGRVVMTTPGPGDHLLVVSNKCGKWQGAALSVAITD